MHPLGTGNKQTIAQEVPDHWQQNKIVPDYILEDIKANEMSNKMESWRGEQVQVSSTSEETSTPFTNQEGEKHSKFVPEYIENDLRVTQMKEEMRSWNKEQKDTKVHSNKGSYKKNSSD